MSMGWFIDLGRQAITFHKLVNWVHGKKRINKFAQLLSKISLFLTGVEIEPGAKIGVNVRIYHGTGTVIGHSVEIGDNCVILHGVTLGAKDFKNRESNLRIHPKVEDNVKLYTGAVIVGPITIGHHSTIGANAVVTKDIPPYSVVVGNPGVIKKDSNYFDETREQ